MMWLTVAEWNPNAIAFYLKYGFERTQVSEVVMASMVWLKLLRIRLQHPSPHNSHACPPAPCP